MTGLEAAARTDTQAEVPKRLYLTIVAVFAVTDLLLLTRGMHGHVAATLSFAAWVFLLVYPAGELWRRQLRLNDTWEWRVPLSLAMGLMAVAAATLVGSLILSKSLLAACLYVVIPFLWIAWFATGTVGEPPSQGGAFPLIVAIITAVHLFLWPSFFSGVDASGRLVTTGIGEDSMYLTIAQMVARTGHFGENPFYAGQPFVVHHFFSEFTVASYLLTFGRHADIFVTRLLFHYALGLPLLIAMMFAAARRLGASVSLSVGLLLCTILPVTSYPLRKGWSGIEGMNFFWTSVHADLNYLFGLILFVAVCLLALSAVAEERLRVRTLVLLQVALAIATQYKANFAIAFYPAAEVVLMTAILRRRQFRTALVAAAAGAVALSAVFGTVLISTRGTMGHKFGFEYGTVALDTMLPILQGNANDGLAGLLAAVSATAGWVKPLAVATAYAVAYTPLFIVVFIHCFGIVVVRKASLPDLYLVVLYMSSLLSILFLIEVGIWKWNASLHLHYLIPLLALFAAARMSAYGSWGRIAVSLVVWGLVGVTAFALWSGARKFVYFYPQTVSDTDVVTLCREIAKNTHRDAILITGDGRMPLDDRYIALLSQRTQLAGGGFVYADLYPDHRARSRLRERIAREGPGVAGFARAMGVTEIGRRDLIVLDRIRPDVSEAPAVCRGDYCFWEFEGLGTVPPAHQRETAGAGTWTAVPFTPATFTADHGKWAIDSKAVYTLAYTQIGQTMTVAFWIEGSSVSSPTNVLRIAIPASHKAVKYIANQYIYSDNHSALNTGMARVYPGSSTIELYKSGITGNWMPSRQGTTVIGQITFEVQ